jgi:hypothetical protein
LAWDTALNSINDGRLAASVSGRLALLAGAMASTKPLRPGQSINR